MSIADFKAVAIYERHHRIFRDQQISVIHIADDLSGIMHCGEGPYNVHAGVEDERELCLGKAGAPAFGRIKQMSC